MKNLLRVFMIFFCVHNCASALECAREETVTRTPCPLLNNLIEKMIEAQEIEPTTQSISVTDLVDAAHRYYGINESLMKRLASARADNQEMIVIASLLDPELFPAHRGSLARADPTSSREFSQVEIERLNSLKTDSRFFTEFHNESPKKQISLEQLKAYQQFCWSKSSMRCFKDKFPAKAELHLLWELLGAYRITHEDSVDRLPLSLVYNFLRYGQLPEDFEKNENGATIWSTLRNGIF